jgi:2'-5' RNA ligase
MHRLFFALWPDPVLRRQIVAVQTSRRVGDGRRIEPADLHLTLAFLGNTPGDQLATVRQAAARLALEPFSLTLDRLGWWRRAGILWLGPTLWPAPLDALVNDLWGGLEHPGLQPEKRRFKPHITLARRCTRARAGPIKPISWSVTDFVLVESVSVPAGVRYRILDRWGPGLIADRI